MRRTKLDAWRDFTGATGLPASVGLDFAGAVRSMHEGIRPLSKRERFDVGGAVPGPNGSVLMLGDLSQVQTGAF